MSVFQDKIIILKINKKDSKNIIYTVFSYEYGKFLANKNHKIKEKKLDLGYIINCEIRTKDGKDIHKIGNIKIKKEFDIKKVLKN